MVLAVMAYLVGAYPNKELPEATVAVFVDQLSGWNYQLTVEYGVDLEVLLVAARNHVERSKWFPTVMELKEEARKVVDGRRDWASTMNSACKPYPARLYLPGGIGADVFWQRLALPNGTTLNVQGGGGEWKK